jgi:hypothetical protein
MSSAERLQTDLEAICRAVSEGKKIDPEVVERVKGAVECHGA